MKFYVDECLPAGVADAISAKRGCRAVHAARDLGYGGRDDLFHIAKARERRAILVTSNHREFRYGLSFLREHPGVVVIDPGSSGNDPDTLIDAIHLLFTIFRICRIGAKPPFRNSLRGQRLVLSSDHVYLDRADGRRLDIWPRDEGWRAVPTGRARW